MTSCIPRSSRWHANCAVGGPKGGQRTYREISDELFAAGHGNKYGRPFSPSSIKGMLS
jgi:hypothetical protein